ncbi:hypothetical protein TNCV_4047751 [Trichonephila clavipes]|nr:hypothetical protein TNCV_4047751 [Trichonephila clavipes]
MLHGTVTSSRNRKKRFGKGGLGILDLTFCCWMNWPMATKNHIATLGWECQHQPSYSHDLAPSDFPLFPALKKNLTGRRFQSN